MSPIILAIDPGVHNGYAEFTDDGNFVFMGQLEIDDMLEFFIKYDKPVSVVIVEDYVIFKKRAIQQSGSNVPAAQVIGAAKMFAKKHGAKFVLQKANILPIAEKLSQKFLPNDHGISHQFSAYNHGFYYLVKQGLRKPATPENPNVYG